MTDEIKKALLAAKVALLFRHPFFGNMAIRMKFQDASSWCPTAATDGRNFYYNRDFILSLSKKELLFLISHEVMHCILDHFGRRNGRHSGIWNMATDYAINGILVKEKVGEMPTRYVVPDKDDKNSAGSQRIGLYDQKYVDWPSEKIYKDLIDQAAEVVLSWDHHIEMGEDASGSRGDEPTMSEETLDEIRGEIRTSIMEAEAAAKSAGEDIPESIARIVRELTEPKMDWRNFLDLHVKSTTKSDFTFSVPNRKTMTQGIILPGLITDETIECDICVDTSGSITKDMLKDFFGEIKGIIDQFPGYSIRIWSFDTKVYGYEEFTQDDEKEITDYIVEKLRGGGGTDFMCNWHFMEENDIKPQKLIMFTDGCPSGEWGVPGYCDTIFLIHDETKTITSPFGQTIHYER